MQAGQPSIETAAAYRILVVCLADLRKVQDLLRRSGADPRRTLDLTEVEKAVAAIERILPPPERPLHV